MIEKIKEIARSADSHLDASILIAQLIRIEANYTSRVAAETAIIYADRYYKSDD